MTQRPAMSKTAREIALCCTLAWSVSCGGAAPPPPAPPPAVPPPAPAVVIAADTSDAPDPSYLVGIVRWKSPQATLETINRWTGLRLTTSTIASELLDKGLAETLAYDAPVDAVVALDPKANDFSPFAAMSVGVRSLEEARRAAQAMGAGHRAATWRVQGEPASRQAKERQALLHLARGSRRCTGTLRLRKPRARGERSLGVHGSYPAHS